MAADGGARRGRRDRRRRRGAPRLPDARGGGRRRLFVVVAGWLIGLRPLARQQLPHPPRHRPADPRHGGVPSTDPYSFTAAGEPGWCRAGSPRCSTPASRRLGGLDGVRVLDRRCWSPALAGLVWRLAAPGPASCRLAARRPRRSSIGVGRAGSSGRCMIGLLCLAVVLVADRGPARPPLAASRSCGSG